MPNIAWVLGAGFSASLGGPMLMNLLRPELPDRLKANFPEQRFPFLFDRAACDALLLYNYGRRFEYGRRPEWRHKGDGQRLWNDPEEFLELIDSAGRSDSGPQARLVRSVTTRGSAPDDACLVLSTAARRLLAAECALFLEESPDITAERWSPYRAWMRHLVSPDDTIITFNYDRVVEIVSDQERRKCQVVLPGVDLEAGRARLLKMHGSLDWSKRTGPEGLRFRVEDDRLFALTCDASNIAMAGPGQSKAELRDQLEGLWRMAESALENADVIVFMGYRFPESDAESRRRLLGGIQRRTSTKYLPIHVVLGPDVMGPHHRRLDGLLRHSVGNRPEIATAQDAGLAVADRRHADGKFNVWVHPLYAQDFMAVVNGGTLMQPYRYMSLR